VKSPNEFRELVTSNYQGIARELSGRDRGSEMLGILSETRPTWDVLGSRWDRDVAAPQTLAETYGVPVL